MLRAPLQRLYERLGPRYPRVVLAFVFLLSCFVVGGGVLLLNLYVDISLSTFWRIFAVSAVLVAVEVGAALWLGYRLVRPADRWLGGERTPDTALAAWSALAGLPVDLLRFGRGIPVVLNTIPISIYVTLELHGTFLSFLAITAGAMVVLAYGVFLRFFVTELAMRPVLADVSRGLPDGADLGKRSVALRGKLLVGLPVINVVTGVVVAGLSSDDPSLRVLGVGVVVALVVAFTLSFELSALLARSVVEPIEDLREGTERVIAGDLGVRVPVLGTDETGRLAESFNQMVAG
ncbi:MAG: HAMP domain-containing protein, partial [Solirubrobacteraceae bacterium]